MEENMNISNDLMICFNPMDLRLPTYSRNSSVKSFEDLKTAKNLRLAHFTSSIHINSIIENGLLPNSLSGVQIVDNLKTDPDCVYLSVNLDTSYFSRAIKKFGGKGIVVVVDVDKTNLVADENSLYPDDLKGNFTDEELLFKSLSSMFGACKHRGIIVPKRIIEIYNSKGETSFY
jgi:hypothetical protein